MKCFAAVGIGCARPGSASPAAGISSFFLNMNIARSPLRHGARNIGQTRLLRIGRRHHILLMRTMRPDHAAANALSASLFRRCISNPMLPSRACAPHRPPGRIQGSREDLFMRHVASTFIIAGAAALIAGGAFAQQPAAPAAGPPPAQYGSPGVNLEQAEKAVKAAEAEAK